MKNIVKCQRDVLTIFEVHLKHSKNGFNKKTAVAVAILYKKGMMYRILGFIMGEI